MSSSQTLNRRLAAIMFSDICGFSRMMGADEAKTMRVLARHDAEINAVLPSFGGKIIKRMGDGVMSEFQSAVSAVECAIALQRRLAEVNAQAPEGEGFQVRIGVHLGDIMVMENEDILGDGVNVAARIEPLATPGGICISQDVCNLIQNKVEVQTLSIGPQQLKNITRQIEIFRVLLEAADRKPAPSSPPPQAKPSPKPVSPHLPDNTQVQPASATSSPQKRIFIGIFLFLFLVFGVLMLVRNLRQKRLNKEINRINVLIEEGKGKEALEGLEKIRPMVPKGSEKENAWEKAHDRSLQIIEEHAIKDRYGQLLNALQEQDFDRVLTFLEPESLERAGKERILNYVKFTRGLSKLGGIQPNEIRLENIQLSPERDHARFEPIVLNRRGGTHHLPWGSSVKRKDTWLFVVPPPRAGEDNKPSEGQNEGTRRPWKKLQQGPKRSDTPFRPNRPPRNP